MNSPKPQPLWELVEQFHAWADANMEGFTAQALAVRHRADELAAALRAWDEQLKDVSYVGEEFDTPVEGNWVREKLLGVPAKEPANSQSETSFPQERK